MRRAYNVQDFQIVGDAPAWTRETRFDIVATAAPGFTGGIPEIRIMLRTLLEERFRVRARTETRDGPIYALVLARGDRRRVHGRHRPADHADGGPHRRRPHRPDRPLQLAAEFDPEVIGIMNRNMGLGTTFSPRPGAVSDRPPFMSALSEQLGLKLEAQRGPVDVVVFDGAELPTPD